MGRIGKRYYESDQLKQEVPYKNNKKNGILTVYRENGKLWSTVFYKDDKAVSGSCINSKGYQAELTNRNIANWNNELEVNSNYQ